MTLLRARRIGLPTMKLIRLKGWPILRQLHLEESLFRTSLDNVCIINDGTNAPSIVMGASGKLAELLEIKPVLRDQVPVIRRFSGGGSVIVDKDTIFITFICNKDAIPGLQPYPRPIMSWSSGIYDEVFGKACDFKLRENDYVFGNRKFGGNAQSITKRRWIHHTSFLWDYEIENMAYLKLPARAPEYRMARSHTEFMCRMKDYLARSEFVDKTIAALGSHFSMVYVESEPSQHSSVADFIPSSMQIMSQEMEAALAESAAEEPAVYSLSKLFLLAFYSFTLLSAYNSSDYSQKDVCMADHKLPKQMGIIHCCSCDSMRSPYGLTLCGRRVHLRPIFGMMS